MVKSSSIHRTYWLHDVAYGMGRVIPPEGDIVYDASPIVGLKLIRLGFSPVVELTKASNSEIGIDYWKDYVKKNRL